MVLELGCEASTPPSPYPQSTYIKRIDFDWSSHTRLAPGSDNWPVTWADDDNQYTSWGDGGGFGGTNIDGRVSLGVARIEGNRQSYSGVNVWGGKYTDNMDQVDGKSYGIISIDGILYQWVSPGSGEEGYRESRLYYSDNYGSKWSLVDWAFKSSYGIVNPTFCQFGKDYADSRDEYVYIYANHVKDDSSLDVQKPGEIVLMRAPAMALLEKSRYEFFTGFDDDKLPSWSNRFEDRKPVFLDPNGVGWNTSVSFNKGLGRYFLITEHKKSFNSNIGIFEAAAPWGPWNTVYYGKFGSETGLQQTTFFYNFSNKWLSDDGLEFVLVFTGTRSNDSWNTVAGKFELAN
jgi:hypothetical protein